VINLDHYAIGEARAPRRRSFNLYALFGLAGALGVLAFIFSAVSPEDDDIQQEFAQGPESRQCLVQNCKSITSIRVTLVDPVHFAVVARTLLSFRYTALERVRMPSVKIGAMVFRSRTGDRSPPTRSSFISQSA
jgi:hypothetical protein